jgi:hypothetical protein
MNGQTNIVKFPYNVSRCVHSKNPRASKNGTPEERAAKVALTAATSGNRRNGGRPVKRK